MLVTEQVNRVSPPEANRPGGAPAYRPSEHPLLPVPTEEELAEQWRKRRRRRWVLGRHLEVASG